jgi:hypothetical protein
MNVYLVFENRALSNGSLVVKAFSSKLKAETFARNKQKRQKNKPQYDDWGLCEGIEYIVAKIKVN